MKKQIQFRQILVTLIILLTPVLLSAQPIDNPYGAGGGDPENAPIDGGLSLLLAAGLGYGAKKLQQIRKANSVIVVME